MRKCVVLLSGGLDSTTALAVAKSEGLEPYALTVVYGNVTTWRSRRRGVLRQSSGSPITSSSPLA